MQESNPQTEPLEYASTPAFSLKEVWASALMKLAVVGVCGELPWISLIGDAVRPSLDLTQRFSIFRDAMLLLPTLFACAISAVVYFRLSRRYTSSMLVVQSLVILYAGLLSTAKYSTWRSWNGP